MEYFKMNVSSPVQSVGGLEAAVVVVASNTTQALAIANNTLPGAVNILTTVPATSGVALPSGLSAGTVVVVGNTIATATSVYPPVGGIVYGAGAAPAVNTAVTLAASGSATFVSIDGKSFFRSI